MTLSSTSELRNYSDVFTQLQMWIWEAGVKLGFEDVIHRTEGFFDSFESLMSQFREGRAKELLFSVYELQKIAYEVEKKNEITISSLDSLISLTIQLLKDPNFYCENEFIRNLVCFYHSSFLMRFVLTKEKQDNVLHLLQQRTKEDWEKIKQSFGFKDDTFQEVCISVSSIHDVCYESIIKKEPCRKDRLKALQTLKTRCKNLCSELIKILPPPTLLDICQKKTLDEFEKIGHPFSGILSKCFGSGKIEPQNLHTLIDQLDSLLKQETFSRKSHKKSENSPLDGQEPQASLETVTSKEITKKSQKSSAVSASEDTLAGEESLETINSLQKSKDTPEPLEVLKLRDTPVAQESLETIESLQSIEDSLEHSEVLKPQDIPVAEESLEILSSQHEPEESPESLDIFEPGKTPGTQKSLETLYSKSTKDSQESSDAIKSQQKTNDSQDSTKILKPQDRLRALELESKIKRRRNFCNLPSTEYSAVGCPTHPACSKFQRPYDIIVLGGVYWEVRNHKCKCCTFLKAKKIVDAIKVSLTPEKASPSMLPNVCSEFADNEEIVTVTRNIENLEKLLETVGKITSELRNKCKKLKDKRNMLLKTNNQHDIAEICSRNLNSESRNKDFNGCNNEKALNELVPSDDPSPSKLANTSLQNESSSTNHEDSMPTLTCYETSRNSPSNSNLSSVSLSMPVLTPYKSTPLKLNPYVKLSPLSNNTLRSYHIECSSEADNESDNRKRKSDQLLKPRKRRTFLLDEDLPEKLKENSDVLDVNDHSANALNQNLNPESDRKRPNLVSAQTLRMSPTTEINKESLVSDNITENCKSPAEEVSPLNKQFDNTTKPFAFSSAPAANEKMTGVLNSFPKSLGTKNTAKKLLPSSGKSSVSQKSKEKQENHSHPLSQNGKEMNSVNSLEDFVVNTKKLKINLKPKVNIICNSEFLSEPRRDRKRTEYLKNKIFSSSEDSSDSSLTDAIYSDTKKRSIKVLNLPLSDSSSSNSSSTFKSVTSSRRLKFNPKCSRMRIAHNSGTTTQAPSSKQITTSKSLSPRNKDGKRLSNANFPSREREMSSPIESPSCLSGFFTAAESPLSSSLENSVSGGSSSETDDNEVTILPDSSSDVLISIQPGKQRRNS